MSNSDVTAEQTLRRALLTERLAAVGALADGLAHEVHNPLNGALLQLAVLQRRLEQPDCEPASLQPVAGLVEEALRRLELLFNDLISFLQPRSPERVPVAVGDRFAAVVTLLRADSQGGKTRVALDVVLELPVVDGGVRLVLANLWPGAIAVSADGSAAVLRARQPDPPA